MSNMNMIIHDMEGHIELGDTFKNPKFRKGNRLQTFDRVVANPMWNQDWWKESDYDADEFNRFPKRSEERRVGKECRSRGWRYHKKKKRTEDDITIGVVLNRRLQRK